VEKDAVDLAMESAEFNDAFLNLFESGPIFEAVDRSDKDAVKKIVNKIRKSVKSKLDQEDVSYYEPNLVARLIAGVLSGAAVGAANGLVNPMSTAKISLGVKLGAAISPGAAVAGAVAGGSLKAITKFWSVRLW